MPEDRDYSHESVGRELKGLYEDGWAIGKVIYYNSALDRFKVQFEKDSDLIAPFEIDGIEVQLL